MASVYHFSSKRFNGKSCQKLTFSALSGLDLRLFLCEILEIALWILLHFQCLFFFLVWKFKNETSTVKNSWKNSGILAIIVEFDFHFCNFCRRQKRVIISGQNLTFLATVFLCNTSMDKMFVQQVNRVHTHVILQNFLYI